MNIKKKILMPEGTALWLKSHTKLSINQIAEICSLSIFKVESIDFSNTSLFNPVEIGQISLDDIKKGEKDSTYVLKSSLDLKKITSNSKRRFVSLFQKKNKDNILFWFLNRLKKIDTVFLSRIVGSTSKYVNNFVNQYKQNSLQFENLTEIDPIRNNLCTIEDLAPFL